MQWLKVPGCCVMSCVEPSHDITASEHWSRIMKFCEQPSPPSFVSDWDERGFVSCVCVQQGTQRGLVLEKHKQRTGQPSLHPVWFFYFTSCFAFLATLFSSRLVIEWFYSDFSLFVLQRWISKSSIWRRSEPVVVTAYVFVWLLKWYDSVQTWPLHYAAFVWSQQRC